MLLKTGTPRSYSDLLCYLAKGMFVLSPPLPLGLTLHCSVACLFPLKELAILSVTFLVRHSGGLLPPCRCEPQGCPQGATASQLHLEVVLGDGWHVADSGGRHLPQEGAGKTYHQLTCFNFLK